MASGGRLYPMRGSAINSAPSLLTSNYVDNIVTNALDSGAKQYAYIRIKVNSQNDLVLTNQHLAQGGLTVDRNMQGSSETFPIGSVCSASASAKILKNSVTSSLFSKYSELVGKKATIMCTVDTTGFEEEGSTITERDFYLGYFIVTDIKEEEDFCEFSFQDYFIYLDFSYDDMVAAGRTPSVSLFVPATGVWYWADYVLPNAAKWVNKYYLDTETPAAGQQNAVPDISTLWTNYNYSTNTSGMPSTPYPPYIYYNTQSSANWCIIRPDNATSMTVREIIGYFVAIECLGNLFINDLGKVSLTVTPNSSSQIAYSIDINQVMKHSIGNKYIFQTSVVEDKKFPDGTVPYILPQNPLYKRISGQRGGFMSNENNYRTNPTRDAQDRGYKTLQTFEADLIGSQQLHPDCKVLLPSEWTTDRRSVLTQVSFTLNGLTHLACEINSSDKTVYTQ